MGNTGWFSTPGRPGDRNLEDQLKGLGALFSEVESKTALDAGCAEGLISIELAKAGALAVHGVEIVPSHVEVANRLKSDLPVTFEIGDLNVWQPKRRYDIVIGLAILQKVRRPDHLAALLADAARDLLVLRLPPAHAPDVVDSRSGNVPFKIAEILERRGFELSSTDEGHLGEWVGYFRRFK